MPGFPGRSIRAAPRGVPISLPRFSAIIAFVLCLGPATTVRAGGPDPANCEAPDLITIVGRNAGGTADPLGVFTVIVRNFNNVPRLNNEVVLDFSTCPDIRLAADQLDPNVVVDCSARTLAKLSDLHGEATFRVIGAATNLGASTGSIGPSLRVYAEGVWIRDARVAALDQNGGGLSGEDLSLCLTDYFSGQAFARSDYDGSGVLDGNDLSLWLAAYFGGGSVLGGSACP